MKYVKVYQYQLEKEGGERVGPSWMHRKEVEEYRKENYSGQRLRIRRYWTKAPKNKFRGAEPERVK